MARISFKSLAALILVLGLSTPSHAANVEIQAGIFGGTLYQMSYALTEILKVHAPEITASAVETNGTGMGIIKASQAPERRIVAGTLVPVMEARAGIPPYKKAFTGLKLIGNMSENIQTLITFDPSIKTIEDLKGLKIRVPNNPVMINTFRAWGCEPTPLAWDETFNALQQKVVDGQENSYVVFASNKFEEVQKYMTELRYKLQIIVMVVNDTWLKKQPADIQQAILEGGRLATKHNREMIMAMEARLKPAMKKAGVEILDKPEDENVWEEKAMALWPDLYPKIGNLDLLDKMMADMHRKRP